MILQFVLLAIVAYFLGAIPFGLIIAKAHGIDLRKVGSGNIGATNVSRALGKKWAYLCFVLDVAKGMIPMLAGLWLVPKSPATWQLLLWLVVGMAAILGHVLPVYLKFKGGKGVATSLGVVLGLWPYFTVCGIITFAIWCVCVLIWKYVSLGSIVAALAFPILLATAIAINPDWNIAQLWPLLAAASLLCILVVLRHKDNIKRLIAGTENKVGTKKS